MTARTFSFVFGLAFIAVGILGFIDNPIVGDSVDAIFLADSFHNIVHIASGVLFFVIPFLAPRAINSFMIIFGTVYLLLGVLGLISIGTSGMAKLLGVLHVNGADNILHLGLGLAIILAGVTTRKADTVNSAV